MENDKLNLESICKELGLDTDGDIFLAVKQPGAKMVHVFINAQRGIINVVQEEEK